MLHKRQDVVRVLQVLEGVHNDLVDLLHDTVELLDLPQHGELLGDEGLEAGGEGGVVGSLLAGDLPDSGPLLLLEQFSLQLVVLHQALPQLHQLGVHLALLHLLVQLHHRLCPLLQDCPRLLELPGVVLLQLADPPLPLLLLRLYWEGAAVRQGTET